MSSKTKQKQSHLPVDRGWAWMIVLGCFGQLFMITLVRRANAILLVEFMDTYEMSAGATSIIPALVSIMQFLTSPFANAFSLRLGARPVVMFGCTCTVVGAVLSALVPGINYLYFTYGVLIGIGFGCTITPTVVLLEYYFEKRGSLAFGLAGIGCGSGMLISPVLIRYLLDEYGLQGSLLLYGGILLNGCIFACLLRPVEFYEKYKPTTDVLNDRKQKIEEANSAYKEKKMNLQNITWLQSGTISRSNNWNPKADSNGTQVIKYASTGDIQAMQRYQNLNGIRKSNLLHRHPFNQHNNHKLVRSRVRTHEGLLSSLTMSSEDIFWASREAIKLEQGSESSSDDSKDTQECFGGCLGSFFTTRKLDPVTGEYTKQCVFQLHLMKNPVFLLCFCAFFFAIIGIPLPPLFLAAYCDDIGFTHTDAALIVSLSGTSEIVVRPLTGLIADFDFVPKIYLTIIALMGMTAVSCTVTFLTSFGGVLAMGISAMACNAMYFISTPLLLKDLMGIEALSATLGLSMIAQALGYLIAPLSGGILNDVTGNWRWTYIFGGFANSAAAIILLFIPILQRMQKHTKIPLTSQDEEAREEYL